MHVVVCVKVGICIYVYMCMQRHACVCACMYVCMCVCVCMYVCMHQELQRPNSRVLPQYFHHNVLCMYVCICMYACIFVCMCMCTYVRMCVYACARMRQELRRPASRVPPQYFGTQFPTLFILCMRRRIHVCMYGKQIDVRIGVDVCTYEFMYLIVYVCYVLVIYTSRAATTYTPDVFVYMVALTAYLCVHVCMCVCMYVYVYHNVRM
jgi:hypothetical protein